MCETTLPISRGKPRRFCSERCRDRHTQAMRRKAPEPTSDLRGPRLQYLDTLIAAQLESTAEGVEILAWLKERPS